MYKGSTGRRLVVQHEQPRSQLRGSVHVCRRPHAPRPSADMATTAPETAPSSQTSTNGPLTDTFSEYVHRIMNKWKVPGMSLAVVDGEDTYAAVCLTFPVSGSITYTVRYRGMATRRCQTHQPLRIPCGWGVRQRRRTSQPHLPSL